MSKRSLSHLELSTRTQDAHSLASLAGVLADDLTHNRRVHPDDADKPDLAAVAYLLRDGLQALTAALEEMSDHGKYLRERFAAERAAGKPHEVAGAN